MALEYAQSRGELAKALLEHPNSDWWFSPLDRSCQPSRRRSNIAKAPARPDVGGSHVYRMGQSRDGKTFLDMAWQPASEGSKAWEQKVQKPLRRISSSTLKGSVSA